jgi:hypothetical protein
LVVGGLPEISFFPLKYDFQIVAFSGQCPEGC